MYQPKRVLLSLLVFCFIAALAACGEPAEGEDNQDNQSNANNDNGSNGNDEDWDEDFLAVADIIRTSCAVAECHGQPAAAETLLEYGANGASLDLEDIQHVLQNYQSGTNPLVDPGNADGSDLYLVLVSEDDQVIMPPPNLQPLPQSEIDTVRDWINDGANY